MPEQCLLPPYLNAGSKGPAVVILQLWLYSEFGLSAHDMGLMVDGEYGPITVGVVMRLQDKLGFTDAELDGNFGPKTRAAIKEKWGHDLEARLTGSTKYVDQDGTTKVWPPEPYRSPAYRRWNDIQRHLEATGQPTTVNQLAAHFGVSVQDIHEAIIEGGRTVRTLPKQRHLPEDDQQFVLYADWDKFVAAKPGPLVPEYYAKTGGF